MGSSGASGASNPVNSPLGSRSAGLFVRETGRGTSLAPGSLNLAETESSGSRGRAKKDPSVARVPGSLAGENLDRETWVREKVLFLLHPERWLGTPGDPVRQEEAGGESLLQAGGDLQVPDCSSRFPQEQHIPGGHHVDAPSRAQQGDSEAPPKSVLVRVLDYQGTREVQQTTWTKGCMTTRTEEHSMTAVTFRTHRV
ncbi:PREDICTED: uncharacterized protein C6orf141 homolog [Chrysochloris asiatica]|uniref:Uncharacterized protein C6orf141 homolog n=1 Tax=Chrysochloris asiatica TaxID=185453 RepID=A0A9B0T7Z5_CHRAS|nr:PREDICTED: uncharacterized protein C6orf141 homolog [Chrysochloris asiatica]